jgi:hypothetical protein
MLAFGPETAVAAAASRVTRHRDCVKSRPQHGHVLSRAPLRLAASSESESNPPAGRTMCGRRQAAFLFLFTEIYT